MNTQQFDTWLQGYIQAWNTNDPKDIGRLFTEDALYYTTPFAEPWRGRDAIVASWLDRKDEPGTFTFHHQILATTPDLGIVRGWTHYTDPPTEYSNIWVVCLNNEGLCTEFTEWWMERK